MAEERTRREQPYPCPFGCGIDVPATARFCPGCTRQVVEFCPDCGHRIKRPRAGACPGCGAVPVTAGARPIPVRGLPRQCAVCKTALEGRTQCPTCHALAKPFKRLCTACRAEVIPPTEDSCGKCGEHFVFAYDPQSNNLFGAGHKVARYIVCRRCRKFGRQFDDFMVLYGIPFVFQTERGVKSGYFASDEDADQIIGHFFGPDDLQAYQSGNDEAPWDFPSNQLLVEFLNGFSCQQCKARDWALSAAQALWEHFQPHVQAGGKAAGGIIGQGIQEIFKALETLRKKGGR